jgi:hypothetical protein
MEYIDIADDLKRENAQLKQQVSVLSKALISLYNGVIETDMPADMYQEVLDVVSDLLNADGEVK